MRTSSTPYQDPPYHAGHDGRKRAEKRAGHCWPGTPNSPPGISEETSAMAVPGGDMAELGGSVEGPRAIVAPQVLCN